MLVIHTSKVEEDFWLIGVIYNANDLFLSKPNCMKIIVVVYLSLLLVSCSDNHFHDGIYKANVFNSNLTWVHEEQIELAGSTMHVTERSAIDNSIQAEYKTSCNQFEDRIEFKDKNGVTIIGRFDDQGNLKYGDYTYNRTDNIDGIATKPVVQKPLIKKVDNRRFAMLPDDKTSAKPSQRHLQDIKTYSDGEISYDYVESVSTNINEPFFQGNKSFAGHIDDVYDVEIDGEQIKITAPQENARMELSGTIKDGKILTESGEESKFRYRSSLLYYHGQSDQWHVFYEIK